MRKTYTMPIILILLVTLTGCVSPPRLISGIHEMLIVIRRYVSADMPYMTDNELGVMIDMLEDADCKVWVASISDDPYESETRTITPDIMVDSVDVENFDAVILPCLAAYTTLPPLEIIELVAEFNKQKKVIAAQYNARLILYELDIITTDQMLSSGVTQEGRIITSDCCPYAGRYYGREDGTRALIEKVITTLNEGV